MTRKWLESFNKWLKDTGIKTNSISIHLRNIRAVFNHAIDNEETELYPFRKFTIEREETRKRSLKPDQLITPKRFQRRRISKGVSRHIHAYVLSNRNKRNRLI